MRQEIMERKESRHFGTFLSYYLEDRPCLTDKPPGLKRARTAQGMHNSGKCKLLENFLCPQLFSQSSPRPTYLGSSPSLFGWDEIRAIAKQLPTLPPPA